jgi:hypothetical protein
MKNTSLPGSICSARASYILFINAKIHANDLTTLFGKIFDKACKNFEKNGKNDQKSINVVFLRVPREIGLESCKLRSIDYFKKNGNSKVSGIFLHQPEFAAKGPGDKEGLTHCYELIINPNKKDIMEKIKLTPKFVVGVWNKGSALIAFINGQENIISKDTEYFIYQSGHIFYQPTEDKHDIEMEKGILKEPCDPSMKIDERSIMRRELILIHDDLLLL